MVSIKHSGADAAARQARIILSEIEHIVPQARFEVALELRQIEIGAAAARQQFLGVVEEEQSEIEQRARDRRAVDQEMLFDQVPAARANK